jgi:hypothetical protein
MTVGCRRVGVTSSASLQQLQGTCLAGADVGRIVMATHFTQPRTTCAVSAPELRTTSCRGSVATPSDERLRRRLSLLIRSILGTTWDEETWPTVKTILARALRMRASLVRDTECFSGNRRVPQSWRCPGRQR